MRKKEVRAKCVCCLSRRSITLLKVVHFRTLEQLRRDKRLASAEYRCKEKCMLAEYNKLPLNETKKSDKDERAMSLAIARGIRSDNGIDIHCSTN
jgi:hypothetical protein